MNTILALARFFFVMSSQVVIGRNYEMADMVNPEGYIYGFAARVFVEAPDGSRWAHDHVFVDRSDRDCEGKAEFLKSLMETRLAVGGELDATHWEPVEPGYGSDAYCAGNWEMELARLERKQAGVDEHR